MVDAADDMVRSVLAEKEAATTRNNDGKIVPVAIMGTFFFWQVLPVLLWMMSVCEKDRASFAG